MVFSSVIFLFLFLPLVLGVYYLLPHKARNIFLLVASLAFYAAGEPKFVLLMCVSILINYLTGLLIDWAHRTRGKRMAQIMLTIGLVGNIGLLFYFKYYDFFIDSMNSLFGFSVPLKHIALPIGISFFTFQGMSYIIDLYYQRVEVQKKFINIALYISMFPQLVAGPIVRYKDINEEIEHRTYSVEQFASGIKRFAVGLAKKLLIANTMGALTDKVFALSADENTAVIAWIGMIAYTLQIYFDFSGYSDMAIGIGRMLGFHFLENFNYPYISKSITEFWRRWHISLSSWFRDYLYIPLGGNRTGNVYVNLFIVFVVTGLWHGAAWTFVIWGLWHGLFIILERIKRNLGWNFHMPSLIQWMYAILVAMIGWVFFRAETLSYATDYIGVLFGANGWVNMQTLVMSITNKEWFVLLLGIFFSFPIVPWINQKWQKGLVTKEVCVDICVILLLLLSIMLVMTSTYNPFIYFRF